MTAASISARVLADSISPSGVRLSTVEMTYPRFVHAELMTHRVFARNSASSRAIPLAKTVERVRTSPAGPVEWGENEPGMQSRQLLDEERAVRAAAVWEAAARSSAFFAEQLAALGVHKQIANRVLEPFLWQTTVVTGTEWDGFFAQRCHPDAQPELRDAASAARDALAVSSPMLLALGEWHLPLVDATDRDAVAAFAAANGAEVTEALIKVSVARCARVSYLTHDGRRDLSADFALYDRLMAAVPPHASPLEHVATPAAEGDVTLGCLHGWRQWRHVALGF